MQYHIVRMFIDELLRRGWTDENVMQLLEQRHVLDELTASVKHMTSARLARIDSLIKKHDCAVTIDEVIKECTPVYGSGPLKQTGNAFRKLKEHGLIHLVELTELSIKDIESLDGIGFVLRTRIIAVLNEHKLSLKE